MRQVSDACVVFGIGTGTFRRPVMSMMPGFNRAGGSSFHGRYSRLRLVRGADELCLVEWAVVWKSELGRGNLVDGNFRWPNHVVIA